MVLVCLAALVCRAEVTPSGLLAGVARADITPPSGIAQMNWGAQRHVAAAGIDAAGFIATALVVSDGRQKFAMVDVDALSVRHLDKLIPRAAAATGIPATHIRLGATHTHAGPMLTGVKGPVGMDLSPFREPYDRYWATVADKIVGAIVEANAKLAPVHVGAGRGVGTININRRIRAADGKPPAVGVNPEGFIDGDLNVVRMDDAAGKPVAVIVNYQCHGTVMAWDNEHISPDWPGMMRKVVERALPGALCLFFQGAAGDQGPVEGFTGDLKVAHRLGTILGHQAAALALQVETTKRAPRFEGFVESTAYIAKQPWRVDGPRDGTLKFASKILELPPRKYTAAEMERMRTAVKEAESQLPSAADKQVAEARLRRVRDLLEQWQRPYDATPVKVRVQVLRIGEVALVAMPGEPFAEIGVAVKKASPFAVTLFCGYSSGEGGDYMPMESEYDLQGYEVDRTPYGRGAAAKLIAEMPALFKLVQ